MRKCERSLLSFAVLLMTWAPVIAIEPTMNVFVEGPLRPIFHGSTNLPDASELILTLSRTESGYRAQSKVTVRAGHFATERFSSAGKPLNPGLYRIEVSMSVAAFQPKDVQAVIGDRGQAMTGRLVSVAPFGGQVFRYVTKLQLGGPANAVLDAAAKTKAEADLRKWVIESCNSIVDLANAGVRSGRLTGHEKVGTERQKAIEACIAEVNRPAGP